MAGHAVHLLHAVFVELEKVKPDGLRYSACKLSDGVSYLHLIATDGANSGVRR